MKPFELEPRYSTNEIPGKCIKCLGEQELNSCLMQLLSDDGAIDESVHKYEALVNFLQSPESQKLRVESEKYLSEGKEVTVRIDFVDGRPRYELKIKE